jgi:hypothetical protein
MLQTARHPADDGLVSEHERHEAPSVVQSLREAFEE